MQIHTGAVGGYVALPGEQLGMDALLKGTSAVHVGGGVSPGASPPQVTFQTFQLKPQRVHTVCCSYLYLLLSTGTMSMAM